MACGAPLARSCPACSAPATVEARFCSACGCALDVGVRNGGRVAVPAEERRRVSILFADIVGYTTVAERLDHESVKALTERYLSRLALEVERFGGYVDQYIGDNIMAVFGAPIAHEDDAERAVRSAWGMQGAMAELNRSVRAQYGLELALRAAVNTGDVLAGRIGDEYTVVGDAVNVAARLEGAAPVGGVLVGEGTWRATGGGAVAYRQLGSLALKGRAEPVSAWQVVSVSEPTAAQRPPDAPRAPLVGRQAELSRLVALSDRAAREGAAQTVTILGEAGVGKTRLVAELERRLQRRVPPTRFLRGRAPGFGSESAFGPLAQMLRSECAVAGGDDAQTIVRKLRAKLGPMLADRGGADAEQRLAPFARLLGAPSDLQPSLAEDDRRAARDSFFGLVRALVEGLSEGQLPVLVWEDAQWADEGTLELIGYLAARTQRPLLQICLARDEGIVRSVASGLPGSARLVLEPLSSNESLELIEALVDGAGLPDGEGPSRLAERCGGNPLFAEALLDSLGEAGPTGGELPGTIRGLLASRLDALPPFERQLLGHAAVLGPSFSSIALEPLARASGAELQESLGELCRKNLIVADPAHNGDGEGQLAFRHMLIREVAYEMLPKAVRARKHAEVGALLEGAAIGPPDAAAAALAEHFTRAAMLAAEARLPVAELARLRASAVGHCLRAGDLAASLFSNGEALVRYRAALDFAAASDPVRFQITERMGEVQSRLGRLSEAIEAWAGCIEYHRHEGRLEQVAELHRKIAAALAHDGRRDEAVKQLQRGIKMIKDGPPSVALARLFGEAATLYMQVGANMLAAYAAERALNVAAELGDPRSASRAHCINGRVLGRIGEDERARRSLERAVELARDSDQEETVFALLAAGRNHETCEGDYEAAERRYREALALAERVGVLPAQIELHAALARIALLRCEWDLARRSAARITLLAEREGLFSKLCLADLLNGRLRWCEAEWEESERILRRAHQEASRLGALEISAEALLSLADTLADGGDPDGAEIVLGQAGALCEAAGLTPLAVEAACALSRLAASGGRLEEAQAEAERAGRLAGQAHDPVSRAAALEASGIVVALTDGLAALEGAQAGWQQLGRRLDGARCLALRGERLRERDAGEARVLIQAGAVLYEQLGLTHLALRCWDLASL